jgi:acyl-CoA reductase-like NAD-dependent aldehyde dehydrogenase
MFADKPAGADEEVGLEQLAVRLLTGPAEDLPLAGLRIGDVLQGDGHPEASMASSARWRARAAQKAWALETIAERAALLDRIADLLVARVDELAELLVREIAKARRDSRDEIRRSAEMVRMTAEEGRRLRGEALYGDTFPAHRALIARTASHR